MRLPAERAQFFIADLFMCPATFAVFIAGAGGGKRALEMCGHGFIHFALGERAGVGDVEDFSAGPLFVDIYVVPLILNLLI